jgi:hypothetical protein
VRVSSLQPLSCSRRLPSAKFYRPTTNNIVLGPYSAVLFYRLFSDQTAGLSPTLPGANRFSLELGCVSISHPIIPFLYSSFWPFYSNRRISTGCGRISTSSPPFSGSRLLLPNNGNNLGCLFVCLFVCDS